MISVSEELDFIKESLIQIREDMTVLKDNHLAHVEKDMNDNPLEKIEMTVKMMKRSEVLEK